MWTACILVVTAALALRSPVDMPNDSDDSDDSADSPPPLVSSSSSDESRVGARSGAFNVIESSESDSSEDELPQHLIGSFRSTQVDMPQRVHTPVPIIPGATPTMQPMDTGLHFICHQSSQGLQPRDFPLPSASFCWPPGRVAGIGTDAAILPQMRFPYATNRPTSSSSQSTDALIERLHELPE